MIYIPIHLNIQLRNNIYIKIYMNINEFEDSESDEFRRSSQVESSSKFDERDNEMSDLIQDGDHQSSSCTYCLK